MNKIQIKYGGLCLWLQCQGVCTGREYCELRVLWAISNSGMAT